MGGWEDGCNIAWPTSGGWLGRLTHWRKDCNTVLPVPVIVSPPGIEADGFAAGLRRNRPQ